MLRIAGSILLPLEPHIPQLLLGEGKSAAPVGCRQDIR